MTSPFESLISDLGAQMDINLKPDAHESCKLMFAGNVAIQIDLTPNADSVLIGCELGKINPGSYREKIMKQALRVNGLSIQPRGVLAFSEKNDALILFQYLPLSNLTGETLNAFLQLFVEHARIWQEALKVGEIPQMAEDRK